MSPLTLQEYGKEYILGTLAYEKEDYKATITHMEKSLPLYYEAYEDCRFLCENPFNQGWFPDFISSVASKKFWIVLSIFITCMA